LPAEREQRNKKHQGDGSHDDAPASRRVVRAQDCIIAYIGKNIVNPSIRIAHS
jgi:hypothetical protein